MFSFDGVRSARLAQRERYTPRNTPTAHLENTQRILLALFADGIAVSRQKRLIRFSKEKIHEEASCGCVDGGYRPRFCRGGAGGEPSMLSVRRLLRLLRRVLAAS